MKRMRRFGSCIALLAFIPGATVAVANTESVLKQSEKYGKHLFVLFVREGDANCAKMKSVFAKAQPSLSKRAVFHIADVSDSSEAAFVRKYGIARAPLPLTLVFAPNGAIVNAFAGKVVSQETVSKAFASPALATVKKALQEGQLALVCAQGKRTKHNTESLAAARAAAGDARARDAIVIVQVAPEDTHNADLLREMKVPSSLREATIFILVPPGTLAGQVEGATTKGSLWAAIMKGISACSGGSCCPK